MDANTHKSVLDKFEEKQERELQRIKEIISSCGWGRSWSSSEIKYVRHLRNINWEPIKNN